jgi:hypothetical protein
MLQTEDTTRPYSAPAWYSAKFRFQIWIPKYPN